MDPIVLHSVLHTVGIGATIGFIILLIVLGVYFYKSYLEMQNLKLENNKLKKEEATA